MTKNPLPFARNKEDYSNRYSWIFIGMFIFFVIILGRLWFLQVIKGEDLRRATEENRIKKVDLPPVRGLILDRDGNILVDNRASFGLCVVKSEVADKDKLLELIADLTGRHIEDLARRYDKLSGDRFQCQNFLSGLSRAELVAIETRRHKLSGINVQVNSVRTPANDVLASHVIGYLGEISEGQLKKEGFENYRPGDLVGKGGIEQSMEKYLQGRRGTQIQEVDSHRRVLQKLATTNPEPGHNVRLTIDSRLQAVAQSLLGERAGAIVAMDPRTFEVLAMASSPTFSLGDFVGGINHEKWLDLTKRDPFHPMENRAVSGQYPPGSTFKIVVALSALAEEIITPDRVYSCPGFLRLGNHAYGCWNKRGHGAVNLMTSLKVSCDVYYYEVGLRLGVDRLAARAREFFGLGRRLNVDLWAEQPGLMPDSAWKERRFKQKWSKGDTPPVSIGQGYVLATPLQVATYTAVLANGGTLYRPHLVKQILDVNGGVVHNFEPEFIARVDAKPEHIQAVQKGLEAVVNDPGGTGRRGQLKEVKAAGKTGTSQVVSLARYSGYAKSRIPYKYRDHAWYTSYAPAEHPEIVVTVLLEHTGGGGANSAPLAKEMLDAYFDPTIVAKKLPPPQVKPDKPTGWSRFDEKPNP